MSLGVKKVSYKPCRKFFLDLSVRLCVIVCVCVFVSVCVCVCVRACVRVMSVNANYSSTILPSQNGRSEKGESEE